MSEVEEVVSNLVQEEVVSNEAQVEDARTQEEKVLDVKTLLMKNLNHFYGQLTAYVKQLPIDPLLLGYAIFNFDQGAMWIEQGVKKLQFKVDDEGVINAVEEGQQPENDQQEHQDGSEGGSSPEASGSDCAIGGEEGKVEIQEEVTNPEGVL